VISGDIDSDYFNGKLPEKGKKEKENWIPRWQNRRDICTHIGDKS
jgi:hypothetical protein